jgi:SsrA-binding protein
MADGKKIILKNKKARHDYEIIEEFEAGMMLKGTEVKSLRDGRGSLVGAFCRISHGELYVYGMNINEYTQGNIHNHDPLRTRKLLMHKKEIKRFIGSMERKGYSLVPLSLYFRRGYVKLKIALAKGKKLYDKRDDIKKKSIDREINRAMKQKG